MDTALWQIAGLERANRYSICTYICWEAASSVGRRDDLNLGITSGVKLLLAWLMRWESGVKWTFRLKGAQPLGQSVFCQCRCQRLGQKSTIQI